MHREVIKRMKDYDKLHKMSLDCMIRGDKRGYEVYKSLAKCEMAFAVITLSRM